MGERGQADRAGRGAGLKRAPRPASAAPPGGSAAALLAAAGFTPVPLSEPGPPFGYALGPVVPGGPEALAFEDAHGLTVGLTLPLPASCEMAGLAPTAERALKLLGAMMLGLQSQALQVTPVSRYRGLEALLLSAHLCPPLRGPARVREALDRLRRTAHVLSRALAEPPDRILTAVRHAAGVRGALAVTTRRGRARVVPSFDPDVSRGRRQRRSRREGRSER